MTVCNTPKKISREKNKNLPLEDYESTSDVWKSSQILWLYSVVTSIRISTWLNSDIAYHLYDKSIMQQFLYAFITYEFQVSNKCTSIAYSLLKGQFLAFRGRADFA